MKKFLVGLLIGLIAGSVITLISNRTIMPKPVPVVAELHPEIPPQNYDTVQWRQAYLELELCRLGQCKGNGESLYQSGFNAQGGVWHEPGGGWSNATKALIDDPVALTKLGTTRNELFGFRIKDIVTNCELNLWDCRQGEVWERDMDSIESTKCYLHNIGVKDPDAVLGIKPEETRKWNYEYAGHGVEDLWRECDSGYYYHLESLTDYYLNYKGMMIKEGLDAKYIRRDLRQIKRFWHKKKRKEHLKLADIEAKYHRFF